MTEPKARITHMGHDTTIVRSRDYARAMVRNLRLVGDTPNARYYRNAGTGETFRISNA